jgi:iron complex outermembrane receptor protein
MSFQKTAIAVAVAQIAALYSAQAWAQTADTNATAPAPAANVVVVSGQRAALQSAQKLKQNSDEVVDSIVAEDIGKLPDRSVTEVLQRIAGVTMDRNMPGDPNRQAVEGSGVAVRGLSYVRSEVNGRDAFSAGGGRSLGFSDVPAELMAGVDVYKNPSAEQIEGALSGLVNLRTAMPFDFKGFKGVVGVNETYATLNKKKAPSGTILLSNRWNTPLGEFGLLVDFAKSKNPTRTDAVGETPYFAHTNVNNPQTPDKPYLADGYDPSKTQWFPMGGSYRTEDLQRTRRGDYIAAQWKPNRDILTSFSYFKTQYHEDLAERNFESSESNWQQQVPGLAGRYDANGKYQPVNATTDSHGRYLPNSSDAVFDQNGVFQKGTISNPYAAYGGAPFNTSRRVNARDSSTRDLSLNVQWRVTPDLTWTNDFQHVRSKTAGFDADVSTGVLVPDSYIDMTGKIPQVRIGTPETLADPHNYYWAYTQEALDRAEATQKTWKTDFKYAFDHPVLRDVRFGFRMADREGENHRAQKFYNWTAISMPWMATWRINDVARLSDPRFTGAGRTELVGIPNFFGGKVDVPKMIYPTDDLVRAFPGEWAKLHDFYQVLCAAHTSDGTPTGTPAPSSGCDKWVPASFDAPGADNHQTEKTRAAYAQLRFGFDDLKFPIDGNIGVRYVQTTDTASGYSTYQPTNFTPPTEGNVTGLNTLVNITPFANTLSYSNKYHDWLPSLNLRMKVNDQLQFRFAVAKAISRPDFDQLRASANLSSSPNQTQLVDANTKKLISTTYQGTNLTGTADGNPLLKPVHATNVDLTAEWYFAKAGSLTASIFNKDIKDIIILKNYAYTVNDVNGKPQSFTVTGPENGAKGTARGFEIAHQQYYDFVPDWLSGIGTQASWTFVTSHRSLNKPVSHQYCAGSDAAGNFDFYINGCDTDGRSFGEGPLTGLSKHTVNLALMYEKNGWSARMAYNWRSRYLVAVSPWGTRNNNGMTTDPTSATFLQPSTGNTQAYGLPLYQAPYGQLDASVFYDFTDKLRVGLLATNLNNAYTRQIMVQHVGSFTRQLYMSGPRYTVQATYAF